MGRLFADSMPRLARIGHELGLARPLTVLVGGVLLDWSLVGD